MLFSPQVARYFESSSCWRACLVQGNRQALDEKLATSDIQLFGRPAGAPGSRQLNGNAAHAAAARLADESDSASEEEDAEDGDAGTSAL